MGQSHCAAVILPLAGDHGGILSPETHLQYDFGSQLTSMCPLVPLHIVLTM